MYLQHTTALVCEPNLSYLVRDDRKTADGSKELDQGRYKTAKNDKRNKRTRISRCGTCFYCTLPDCDKCQNCLDKPRNGGAGVRKKMCLKRDNCLCNPPPLNGRLIADALKLKD